MILELATNAGRQKVEFDEEELAVQINKKRTIPVHTLLARMGLDSEQAYFTVVKLVCLGMLEYFKNGQNRVFWPKGQRTDDELGVWE